jgi:hypothetical protein
VCDKGIGQLLCAAARDHPSDDMRHAAKHESEAGCQRSIERHHPVRGDAAKQRARPIVDKYAFRECIRGAQCTQAELRKRERMSRPS